MKKPMWISAAFSLLVITAVLVTSCGGGHGGGTSGGGTSASGNVALFATDATTNDLSGFEQVILTINKVQLVNTTGTGETCNILTAPITTDVARLSSVLQFLNVSSCPAVTFDRIHMEFNNSVLLTSPELLNLGADKATEICSFSSALTPSINLECNAVTCSLDINDTVQVLANQDNRLGLDFILKDFQVDVERLVTIISGTTISCAVGIKVSPLNASDIDNRIASGFKEGINGQISNLNITAKTFTISKGTTSLTINYSSLNEQNIDTVLQLAVTNNLTVQVQAPNLFATSPVATSAVFVKIQGMVSNLDISTKTFTLSFDNGKTILIDFSAANVEGQLSDNAAFEVKLNGFNETNFTAINVESSGVETED